MDQGSGSSSSSNTKVDSLMKGKYRAWCFTSFNEIEPNHEGSEYMIAGREVCPTTGREHWQGFIYFKSQRTFNGVRKILGRNNKAEMNNIHLDKRYANATNSEAIQYCMKEGNYFEHGKPPSDNGVKKIKETIDEYDNLETFIEDHSELYVRYRNGIKDIFNMKIKAHNGPREVIWIYGPSGSGKSRMAREICEDNPVSYENSFFDYHGESEVIYDDFRASDMKLNLLLKITDRYKMNVNIKGGSLPWAVKKIVFTSILPPWVMYKNVGENLTQIRRRITQCINLGMDEYELDRHIDLGIID